MDAKTLVEHCGGVPGTAAALSVSEQTVYNWLKVGIPETRQAWIQVKYPAIFHGMPARSTQPNDQPKASGQGG